MTTMMNRRQPSNIISVLCVLIILMSAQSMFTHAQNVSPKKDDYALIYVSVFDTQGHSVYGAPVKIRRAEEKKARWEGYSDHRGEFAQRLPVGKMDYIVWVDLKDKASAKKTEVKVSVDFNERQDVALHLN